MARQIEKIRLEEKERERATPAKLRATCEFQCYNVVVCHHSLLAVSSLLFGMENANNGSSSIAESVHLRVEGMSILVTVCRSCHRKSVKNKKHKPMP